MKVPSFSGIRTRLILLVCLMIVLIVFLTAYNAKEQRFRAVEHARAQAENIIHFAVLHEEEILRETREIVATLAGIPEVREGGDGCRVFLANFLRNYPRYLNFGVASRNGDVICSAIPFEKAPNIFDRLYFRRALEIDGFSIGEYQVGRITGKPSINFGYPIPGPDGNAGGVIFAALDLSYVTKFEYGIDARTPADSTYVKLDGSGNVLSSYPSSQFFGRGGPGERAVFDRISKEKQGMFEARGADGIDRLYLFSTLGGGLHREGAHVLLGISKDQLLAGSERYLTRNIAVLTAVSLVTLLAVWFLGERMIVRPVGVLVNASTRLAAGDLTVRTGLSPGRGELGQLGHAFDRMADELEKKDALLSDVQARFAGILAASPAILYVCGITESEDGKRRYPPRFISDKISELFGYDVREVLDAPDWWSRNAHPEDLSEAREIQALFSHGRLTREYRFRDKQGRYRWVLDQSVLLRDRGGSPVEFLGSWTDITERKETEENLSRSQRLESVGRLAGGIAHDFNNLLTAILGYGELLEGRLSSGDRSLADVREIRRAADRAAGLTRQLLAFSRKQVLQPRVIDLNAVVTEMDRMLRRLIGEDIDVVTKLDPALWSVKADPGQIEQVVMNLVVNARDAMPEGGRLTIETANFFLDEEYSRSHLHAPQGDYVMMAVSDTGTGMDAETMSRIFEPFFTTKEIGKGTGLGLSTAYGIVKQSGGYIWAYSEPGRGTTMKIYFPRTEGRTEALPVKVPPAGDLRGGETILVVEDDEALRSLACEILRSCGYTLLVADNGIEALRVAEKAEGEIHLLLTDVILPRLGGRELYETLAPLRPGMKVLYMSGYTGNAIVHQGELEPGTAFLQKPFTSTSLARKVKDVLYRTG